MSSNTKIGMGIGIPVGILAVAGIVFIAVNKKSMSLPWKERKGRALKAPHVMNRMPAASVPVDANFVSVENPLDGISFHSLPGATGNQSH
jgi:hypothetical protein